MAKEQKQKELELEDTKKAEDPDGATEVVIVSEENKKPAKVEESDVDKRIKDLQDQMAKSDADRKLAIERADRLEKERKEATDKAEKAEGRAASSQKEAITNALSASEEALVVNRAALKSALESTDSQAVVEAQEKLAEAKYLNSELKKNKLAFEQWEKQQEDLAKRPKQTGPSPAAQKWIDANPRFTTDTEYAQEAEAAYALGLNRGYSKDSVEHYKFVDSRLKQIYVETKVQEPVEEQKKKEKETSYSAPPSRGSSGERESNSDGKIYLTPEQAEAADSSKMTPLEYYNFLSPEQQAIARKRK